MTAEREQLVLSKMSTKPESATAIADRANMDYQTVWRTLHRLEQSRRIYRIREANGRVTFATLHGDKSLARRILDFIGV